MVTDKELEVASAAVGWDLPRHDVEVALEKWADVSLSRLERIFDEAVRQFEKNGTRGVFLADEIDMLRIAIAVREIRTDG